MRGHKKQMKKTRFARNWTGNEQRHWFCSPFVSLQREALQWFEQSRWPIQLLFFSVKPSSAVKPELKVLFSITITFLHILPYERSRCLEGYCCTGCHECAVFNYFSHKPGWAFTHTSQNQFTGPHKITHNWLHESPKQRVPVPALMQCSYQTHSLKLSWRLVQCVPVGEGCVIPVLYFCMYLCGLCLLQQQET